MKRVFIIAEAGVNHNGSIRLARRLIDTAKEVGADAVKFQTFRAERLVGHSAEKADYQKKTTSSSESHWQMIKNLELSQAAHQTLVQHCRKRKIEFMSTPFDEESLQYLVSQCGIRRIKIPSGEIVNSVLLLEAAKTGLPLVVSTGMSTLKDVQKCLGVLAFGYLNGNKGKPGASAFAQAFKAFRAKKVLKEKVTLLHCTTEYPLPYNEVNLLAMDTLRDAFGLPVGFSDHTPGISASIAAVARGALVIEKHFTLSRSLPGPDHKASLLPQELCQLITCLRETEKVLGSFLKKPTPNEKKNIPIVRKSLVASHCIRKGERFSRENITAKRPGNGVSPMRYWDLLGKKASKNYQTDEMVTR